MLVDVMDLRDRMFTSCSVHESFLFEVWRPCPPYSPAVLGVDQALDAYGSWGLLHF